MIHRCHSCEEPATGSVVGKNGLLGYCDVHFWDVSAAAFDSVSLADACVFGDPLIVPTTVPPRPVNQEPELEVVKIDRVRREIAFGTRNK